MHWRWFVTIGVATEVSGLVGFVEWSHVATVVEFVHWRLGLVGSAKLFLVGGLGPVELQMPRLVVFSVEVFSPRVRGELFFSWGLRNWFLRRVRVWRVHVSLYSVRADFGGLGGKSLINWSCWKMSWFEFKFNF